MSVPLLRPQKKPRLDVVGHVCLLCKQSCDEDHRNFPPAAWKNLYEKAEMWAGLDTFGTLLEDVSWETGPKELLFFHKLCKTELSNSRKLGQAIKRREKLRNLETTAASSSTSANAAEEERTESAQHTRARGIMHKKDICVWCMKPEDRKHGNDLLLIQSKTMWNKVKSHTIYLKDEIMRDRILGVIRATPDPFAAEIRYHKPCSLKYLHPLTVKSDTDNVQNVRNDEIKILFLNHVRKVILELNEPRTLTGLFMDYNSFADNFGACLIGKTTQIKDMIVEGFGDEIGFHKRYHKNESTIVYSTASGGSYVEAAIYAWGISDEQLINSAARRLKSGIDKRECMSWPPTVEELEESEKPNPLLQKFIQWLAKPSCKNTDDCDEPEVHTLASLLESYITRKRCMLKVKLSMTLYGLTRSREIIDIMKKLGLGILYYDVTNLYATWTKHDMEKGGQCPPEIAENYPGTAIMDNDDFKDDTLTGADITQNKCDVRSRCRSHKYQQNEL